MATSSIASLVVSFEANIAKFATDMRSAADVTQKTMSSIQHGAAIAQRALGALGVALSAGAIASWSREVIAAASDLQKLSTITGSSVESLSRLSNIARISGTDFGTFETLLTRMTASMAGVDEQSSKGAKALQFLGISAKDPAAALQEVADKLAKYADGASKAALARDLFGKGGAQFLDVLKDMAEAHNVAATTTTKQAEEGEKLEKALRRISIESTTFKNALLSEIVPALNHVITRFQLARATGEGFFGAILRAGTNIDTLPDQIRAAAVELERIERAAAAGKKNPLPEWMKFTDADVAAQKSKLAALKAIWGQSIVSGQGDNSDQVSRAFMRRPGLGYTGGGAGADAAGAKAAVADYADEIRRLNDAMAKLTGADGGYSHLVAANQQYQKDLAAGKVINLEQARAMLQTAAALDEMTKQYKDWDEAMARAIAQAEKEQEALRRFEDAQKQAAKSTEDMILGLNEQTRTMFMSNEEAQRSIELAKLQRQYNEGLIPSLGELAKRQEELGAAFARRNAAAALRRSLEEQAAAIKAYNDIFVNSFADSVASVATGARTMKEAINDMERSIVASISRIAAQNIAEAIFGKTGQGGMGSVVASLFGTSGGSMGGGIHGGAIGDWFVSLFGAANGTNYAPGGMTLVGERGPEIVNLPRGAQVIPNDVLTARSGARDGMVVNQTVNVLPGASTRTAKQAATMAGIELGRAMRSNA